MAVRLGLPRGSCSATPSEHVEAGAAPYAIASFDTKEEAEDWLRSHPSSPARAQPERARWAWVSVAGEPYLAVYHPNIDHRALYPLSMARGYEVEPERPG